MNIYKKMLMVGSACLMAGNFMGCGTKDDDDPTPASTYSVGGAYTGITIGQSAIIITNNDTDDTTLYGLSEASGTFTFANKLANGADYDVRVKTTTLSCLVSNGTGTISSANVNDITITCQ